MMKALLLDGFSSHPVEIEKIKSQIIEELEKKRFEVEDIILKDIKIAPCQGYFDCWVKTPGKCRIADFGRDITSKTTESNLVIHFTPITFGGFSYELKKVIDRFIPVLLPFFTKRMGESHHKFRYEKRPSVIAIGVLDKPSEEKESIFKELIHRNFLNMGGPVHEALIYTRNQETNLFISQFTQFLNKVEAST